MELKVWVDGIQRVVCGASLDTTCQDVVIALAHAMGRTGRFTLVEKWRDNERPLTPAESPLRALHKWGEYASEVRFVLCQNETRQHSRRPSLDRLDTMLLRKAGERGGSSRSSSKDRTTVFSQSLSSLQGDATVKRSLTFSGAHNQLPEDSSCHSSSGTTSKLRRTNQGPVPHGDTQKVSSANPSQPLTANTSSCQQQDRDNQRTWPPLSSSGSAPHLPVSSMPPPSSSSVPHHHQHHQPPLQQQQEQQYRQQHHQQQQQPYHPVPPPRRRSTPSPRSLEGTESTSPVPSAFTGSGSKALRASSVMPPQATVHNQQQQEHKHQQPPVHPPRSTSLPSHQQLPHQVYRPQPRTLPETAPEPTASAARPTPNPPARAARDPASRSFRSPEPPPLPVSPPPPLPHGKNALDPQATLAAIEASILASDHSRQASLEMEEYDLDRNFPDSHQSLGMRGAAPRGPPPPALGTEYRLDSGLGVSGHGEGGGDAAQSQQQQQLEGEHARLLRLIHMQQEKIQTYESQLSLVNTEIDSLEEKEQAYEEQLHVVMEELLLQEGRQRELEAELGELEDQGGGNWDAALYGEQQRQLDLTLQIASVKAQILDCQHRLLDTQSQEEDLTRQLQQAQEEKAKEEEARRKVEAEEEEQRTALARLQEEVGELQRAGTECEASLASVEAELGQAERALEEKRKEVQQLETSLQEEEGEVKVKVKQAPPLLPAAPDQATLRDAGEKVLRILEGRASPRPPGHPLTATPASSTTTTTASSALTVPVSLKPPSLHEGSATLQLLSALAPNNNQSGVWV